MVLSGSVLPYNSTLKSMLNNDLILVLEPKGVYRQ